MNHSSGFLEIQLRDFFFFFFTLYMPSNIFNPSNVFTYQISDTLLFYDLYQFDSLQNHEAGGSNIYVKKNKGKCRRNRSSERLSLSTLKQNWMNAQKYQKQLHIFNIVSDGRHSRYNSMCSFHARSTLNNLRCMKTQRKNA